MELDITFSTPLMVESWSSSTPVTSASTCSGLAPTSVVSTIR